MSEEARSNNLWERVSLLVDQLQEYADRPEKYNITESRDLLRRFKSLSAKTMPELTSEHLSVVYCEYGTQKYELVSENSDRKSFFPDNEHIVKVITNSLEPKDYPWFRSSKHCGDGGFAGYGSVLVVPMRLSSKRNIGAFVLHSQNPNAFDETLRRVMDVLSDRLASLIRSLRRLFRDRVTYDLRNNLVKKISLNNCLENSQAIRGEYEILQEVFDHLKNHWFEGETEEVHILIRNSLDTDTYFWVTNGGNVKVDDDYRTHLVYRKEELESVFIDEDSFEKLNLSVDDGKTFAYEGFFKNFEETESYPKGSSWLGVSILHPEGYLFGHIIIRNSGMRYAFDDDDLRFVDSIADFTGFLLSEYRERETKSIIDRLRAYPLTGQDQHDVRGMSVLVSDYLEKLYGVSKDCFKVISLQHHTQRWKVDWPNGGEREVTIGFQNLVLDHVNTQRVILEESSDAINPYKQMPLHEDEFLITPMRSALLDETDDYRVVGACMVPAAKPGLFATAVIDRVSDEMGRRISVIHRKNRYQALTRFINAVATMSSVGLTESALLDKAHEYIEQVMFSENLYIALYNESENEISFPLINKSGRPWVEMTGHSRKIDYTRLGRTEVIIRDKAPLLITTLQQSKDWYDLPDHEEYAGNPLASWVGVPIFDSTNSGVRGVIAAYHENLEYVYTQRDVYFLELVAGAVSGLFRALKLKEANKQLEEAQNKIAEQQHVLSTALLSQDLTHRLNNTIGATSINVGQAVRDIQYVRDSGDFSIFDFTTEALLDIDLILKDLVKEIQSISGNEHQVINLVELISKVVKQISIAYRLKDKGIKVSIDAIDSSPCVTAHYRTLFNTFASLLENSAHSVLERGDKVGHRSGISIAVCITEKNVEVSICDTGEPVHPNIEPHLFEYGVSSKGASGGFGLWRARSVAESLGGGLSYSKGVDHKKFTLSLPLGSTMYADIANAGNKKVAYILDDEASWRRILSRWISEESYHVVALSSSDEMLELLELAGKGPHVFLLDIALDKVDGTNYDGLGFIPILKEKWPSARIIIISGYPEAAKPYANDVDAVLSKVDTNGVVLTKPILAEALSN